MCNYHYCNRKQKIQLFKLLLINYTFYNKIEEDKDIDKQIIQIKKEIKFLKEIEKINNY
jgi:hypothetical protein